VSHRMKIALIVLAATGMAACKHAYFGGDAGRFRAAPAATHAAPPVSRN